MSRRFILHNITHIHQISSYPNWAIPLIDLSHLSFEHVRVRHGIECPNIGRVRAVIAVTVSVSVFGRICERSCTTTVMILDDHVRDRSEFAVDFSRYIRCHGIPRKTPPIVLRYMNWKSRISPRIDRNAQNWKPTWNGKFNVSFAYVFRTCTVNFRSR